MDIAKALWVLWIIVQCVIGYNLVMPLLMALFSLFSKKRRYSTTVNKPEADYGIIVTAYVQTHLLPAVVDSILQMDYSNYIVYIVADKCDVTNLKFDDPRIIVLRPEETLGSNTRSHFYAINRFKRNHERLTIIDSDNLVEPTYLNEIDKMFDAGYAAVQGTRKAKNLNSTLACLDAARDMYYHYYDGELLFRLGSSATLAGSGMAFTTALYKECLGHLDVTGAGFDKVLQYEIVSRGYRIAFNGAAVVYDEKTTNSDQLVKQRARWINTWFRYFGFGFSIIGKGITRFNWNQFLFGVVLLRPPLFMFLLLSMVFTAVNLLISPFFFFIWLAAFAAFVLGFAIGIVHAKPDKVVYRSLLSIPKFIFLQVLSLSKSRRANQLSVATTHLPAQNAEPSKTDA